ncbi:phage tail tape measure protein [Nitratireductor aquibiodomus]|uniref:phage tail tape measure protein n=1 Tax=Nitratireductor aquibiodomus TaxID=204799 RepID=UPI0019D3B9D9|nr:phage tail tape measure protein [Nitratireductor aquibiodomus]MBN7764062.1 phage tail tape measure protein [Nitratireductor aquibiodomus]
MATQTASLIVSLLDRVTGPARRIGGALDLLQRKGVRNSFFGAQPGAAVGRSVRNLVAMGAGYVGVSQGIRGTVGAAIKFEEAFADVRKVVDGTPGQLQKIRSEIIGMSKELPVTAEGIASIYAAAGQSNVPLHELGRFAEMATKVSVAWDTSQSETGEALAKIKTQLNLGVDGLGLYADAINHLSNNTASAAPDLVDFAKRVAANGKMFGYQETQTLAFGASMISAGAQSEVAATSFRNMGRALVRGEQATKAQRQAFKALGLDAVNTAKSMQKNALKTTLDVFDRIQALPEWQRASIASALFGDEARALLPVIADTRELRRQLALVGTEANYSGSAFEEYLVRSETAANALQLIGNQIRGIGIGIGDSWLPIIKEFGLGIGDVLDTLDKRVGVLDHVKTSVSGFMAGIGYGGTGGIRELVNDIGDVLFGKAFEGELRDADERVMGLAKLSNQFRGIGRDLRSFSDNIAAGNLGEAVASVGNALSRLNGGLTVGGALVIAATGRALLGLAAGAASLALSRTGQIFLAALAIAKLIDAVQGAESLGAFVENLKGLSSLEWAGVGAGLLIIGSRIWRIARGLTAIKSAGGLNAVASGTPKSAGMKPAAPYGPPAATVGAALRGGLKGGLLGAAAYSAGEHAIQSGLGALSSRMYSPNQRADADAVTGGPNVSTLGNISRLWESLKGLDARAADATGWKANVGGINEVSVAGPVETQPSGVQEVRVTNPAPAPNVSISVQVQTNADPDAIARATELAFSRKYSEIAAGAFSDGAN